MTNELLKIQSDLKKLKNPAKAALLARYFKTGKGEYGAGDTFLGITVPQQRAVAKKYVHLTLPDISLLLKTAIHEYRFTALEILVMKYEQGSEADKKKIVSFYISHLAFINNWDLVDTSAPYILGDYLFTRGKKILYKLAVSKNIWKRRVAIISTFGFIKHNQCKDTLRIAEILLQDTHDLIHKAVGWALREVGKKDNAAEIAFLDTHYKAMPRTMLRYAIEKFDAATRAHYLAK